MTIQIPIVVSHSQRANNTRREYEENLVTRLMLDEGADVRLIGDVCEIDPNSTDLLMLEGISGAFAMLCWDSPENAMKGLRDAGISGRRAAHPGDKDAPSEKGRRIYFVTLSDTSSSVDEPIRLIKLCSADQSMKTVQLDLGGSEPIKALNIAKTQSPEVTAAPNTPQVSEPNAAPSAPDPSDSLSESAEAHLESLVEDLDNLDL